VAFIQQRVELYNAGGGSLLTQYLAGHGNTRAAREESLLLTPSLILYRSVILYKILLVINRS
jgi:hypothetical protein